MSREDFWRYCVRTDGAIKARSRASGLPCDVDKYFIDELFIIQDYRCEISGLPLKPPTRGVGRHPFSPSLDRVVPSAGYTKGNVRLVCMMVNLAMSDWGEENLYRLVEAMAGRTRQERDVCNIRNVTKKLSMKSTS